MNIDFNKINSITKYPSILTYHELGERGKLKNVLNESSKFNQQDEVNIYEKIDGENSRIVFMGDGESIDYVIGSREDLLFARGDRIGNPSGNIAQYFIPLAERLAEEMDVFSGLLVVYLESYGGKTKKNKQYTSDGTQYGRMFDVFSLEDSHLHNLLAMSPNHISSWRKDGNQPYFSCKERDAFAKAYDIPASPLLASFKGGDMTSDVSRTYEWLEQFKKTQVGINQNGMSEGVIARTPDRDKITKIRMEDYMRTLK